MWCLHPEHFEFFQSGSWYDSSPSPVSSWELTCLSRVVSSPALSLLSHFAAFAKSSADWWSCLEVPPCLSAAAGSCPGPEVQPSAAFSCSGTQWIIHKSNFNTFVYTVYSFYFKVTHLLQCSVMFLQLRIFKLQVLLGSLLVLGPFS